MHPGDFSSRNLVEEIEGFVSRARLGGLILLSPISQKDALARRLRNDGVPYVRISPKKNDSAARIVVSNDRRGAEMMTEYLASIGHRTIGFVSGPTSNLSAQEKYEGFRSVMQKNGLSLRKTLVAQGENTFESGFTAGKYLLNLRNRPSVVFASNDAMALGVLKTATMLGMKVPEEISIAGFDDSALASVTWPDLTTIHQPVERMGEMAAKKLLAQLTGGSVPSDMPIATEPELVVRHSTMKHS
jgi:LacI family transcriptional regulator